MFRKLKGIRVRILSYFLAVFIVVGFVAMKPAGAAVLLNDNFDSENGGVGALNYNGFSNWKITNGTVDLIGNGFFDFLPGHGLYVDLDGSTNKAGLMSSSFILTPGKYALQFELAGSQRGDTNQVHVQLGTVYAEFFDLVSSDPFTLISRTIDVTSSETALLSFHNSGGDNMGFLLDNVKLESVPEPSIMLLLTSGLVGLMAFRKKYQRC